MNHRDQLIAYLATLAALVLVFDSALLAGVISPGVLGKIELFALGTVTGGLIGALRVPQGRPGLNVEQAGQVGPNGPAPTEPQP